MAASRKIQPYVDEQTWGGIVTRLTEGVRGPAWVGIDRKTPLTATLYHQGQAEEHRFHIETGAAPRPIDVTDLGLHEATINEILDVMRTRGLQDALALAGRMVKGKRAERAQPKLERDLAMVELHLVHGWDNKADIYGLIQTKDRTFLDDALGETSLTELPGYPTGQVCADKVQEWDRVYRDVMLAEETASRMRDSMIRGLAFGWHGTNPDTGKAYTLTTIGGLGSLTYPRVIQICKPGYNQARNESKRAARAAA